MCADEHTCVSAGALEAGRRRWDPGAGVTGSCEAPGTGWDWTWVLPRNRGCSSDPPSHLPSLPFRGRV